MEQRFIIPRSKNPKWYHSVTAPSNRTLSQQPFSIVSFRDIVHRKIDSNQQCWLSTNNVREAFCLNTLCAANGLGAARPWSGKTQPTRPFCCGPTPRVDDWWPAADDGLMTPSPAHLLELVQVTHRVGRRAAPPAAPQPNRVRQHCRRADKHTSAAWRVRSELQLLLTATRAILARRHGYPSWQNTQTVFSKSSNRRT